MEKTFIIGSCRIQKPFQLLSNELNLPINCENIGPNTFCHYSNEVIQYISFFYRSPEQYLINADCIIVPPELKCKHFHNAEKYIIEISSIKNILDAQNYYLNIVKVNKSKKQYASYNDTVPHLVDNLLTISYLLDDKPILFVSHFNPGNQIPNREKIIIAMQIAEKQRKNITFLNPTKFVESLTLDKATLPGKPTEYSPEMLNIVKNEIMNFIYSNS